MANAMMTMMTNRDDVAPVDRRSEVVVALAEEIASAYPTALAASREALDLAEGLLGSVVRELRERGALRDSPSVLRLSLAATACHAFTQPSVFEQRFDFDDDDVAS